jgi:hypothetical protein
VHVEIARLEGELAQMAEALAEARTRAGTAEARAEVAETRASEEAPGLQRRSPPSRVWPSGSKRWLPSTPSSHGGSGFS